MDIHYEIEFYAFWHCGSGLAAGADMDVLVIKDSNGLPYVPGKTIKGLIREAAEDILTFRRASDFSQIAILFGNSSDRNNLDDQDSLLRQGCAFFSDAVLTRGRSTIISENIQKYLFRSLSSTAIDDRGTAVEHSLRKIEVTLPCILDGVIMNVPEECVSLIEDSFKFIKRLGQNRNRGLGRCDIRRKEEVIS